MKNLIVALAFVFIFSDAICQEKFTVSGYVRDSITGEYLIGANVYIKELLQGSTTNTYGFFSITVDKGNYRLVTSFIGYDDKIIDLDLKANIRLQVMVKNSFLSL